MSAEPLTAAHLLSLLLFSLLMLLSPLQQLSLQLFVVLLGHLDQMIFPVATGFLVKIESSNGIFCGAVRNTGRLYLSS